MNDVGQYEKIKEPSEYTYSHLRAKYKDSRSRSDKWGVYMCAVGKVSKEDVKAAYIKKKEEQTGQGTQWTDKESSQESRNDIIPKRDAETVEAPDKPQQEYDVNLLTGTLTASVASSTASSSDLDSLDIEDIIEISDLCEELCTESAEYEGKRVQREATKT
ncbi:uncharacterized protein [Ptychodera flava]|uniref:uncharacterized protein n=1 Tax=Ptychodera flava TaxID=63121 RepID=UPI003969CB80